MAIALVTAVACTPGPGASSAPTHSASHPADATVAPATPDPGPATTSPEYPAAIVDPIVADAAQRAGVDESAVSIVSYEEVTWPDGSLGCPQPGMGYIQVLIDGYKLIVRAGEVEYDYRGSGVGEFELCPSRGQPAPGATLPGSY